MRKEKNKVSEREMNIVKRMVAFDEHIYYHIVPHT